ncbi:hypothetical protein [Sphingobacterium detergens]|uniref:hypothetical protein n=1 Tax=Sphingobacterium detergens TaxID=1145106 RepID=UPI003AAEFF00
MCVNSEPKIYICFVCGGDGKETCTNPDHGLLGALGSMGASANESACPVCCHDPNHKIKSGGPCECCSGTGKLTEDEFAIMSNWYAYDDEPTLIEEE